MTNLKNYLFINVFIFCILIVTGGYTYLVGFESLTPEWNSSWLILPINQTAGQNIDEKERLAYQNCIKDYIGKSVEMRKSVKEMYLRKNIRDCDTYLKRYPSGYQIDQVIKRRWELAQEFNDEGAYSDFLNKYGGSSYADIARESLLYVKFLKIRGMKEYEKYWAELPENTHFTGFTLLCFSLDMMIEKSGSSPFSSNLGDVTSPVFYLFDKGKKQKLPLTIDNFDQRKHNGIFFYYLVPKGTYQLGMIELTKTVGNLSPFDMMAFSNPETKWQMAALFKPEDEITISGGETTYIGSFKISGVGERYLWRITSVGLSNKIDQAKERCPIKIKANCNRMQNRLMFSENRKSFTYLLLDGATREMTVESEKP